MINWDGDVSCGLSSFGKRGKREPEQDGDGDGAGTMS